METKLSSVLDITYKNPYQFEVNADVSLLGASVSVENVSEDSKFSAIVGARYRDNSLLLMLKKPKLISNLPLEIFKDILPIDFPINSI